MSDEKKLNVELPVRKKRRYVAENFLPDNWNSIEGYCKELLERNISSVDELNEWLLDWSELESALSVVKDAPVRFQPLAGCETENEVLAFWINQFN